MSEERVLYGDQHLTSTRDKVIQVFTSVLDSEEVRTALAQRLHAGKMTSEAVRDLREKARSAVDSFARGWARDIFTRAGLSWETQ